MCDRVAVLQECWLIQEPFSRIATPRLIVCPVKRGTHPTSRQGRLLQDAALSRVSQVRWFLRVAIWAVGDFTGGESVFTEDCRVAEMVRHSPSRPEWLEAATGLGTERPK